MRQSSLNAAWWRFPAIHPAGIAAAFTMIPLLPQPAHGEIPNPAFPVGKISAGSLEVQAGTRPNLTWSIRLPDGENPANYTHFIRQTLLPSFVNYDTLVPPSGQMVSPLAVEPDAARFELWTIRNTTLASFLLDSTIVSSTLPTATVSIRSEDPYPHLARTRADRPFSVEISVQGLIGDPSVPDASRSVTLLRHVQSYGTTGNGDQIDRSQATVLAQSPITDNGSFFLNISDHSIPGNNGPNARGEERFSIMTLDDHSAPASVIDTQFIQVWPVAKAMIDGIAEGQVIGPTVPAATINLTDLYPSSTTFAQIYQGQPRTNAKGKIIPNTTFAINSSTPQNRSATIQDYLTLFESDGAWTLEILTQTPFGLDRILARAFAVQGTASIRETWRLVHFGSPNNTGDAADTNDFDHDGVNNLLEFAFGLNPKSPDATSLPTPQPVGDHLLIDFIQPPGVGGITYVAEWSVDPGSDIWTPLPNTAAPPRHTFRLEKSASPTAFMRMKVIGQ